jgi:hypothetical protein
MWLAYERTWVQFPDHQLINKQNQYLEPCHDRILKFIKSGIDFFFFWYWGLNSGPLFARQVLPLEPFHQHYTLVIFEIESHFMSELAWTSILFVLPPLTGMTGTPHHTHPLLEIGSHELFAQAGHEHTILLIYTSHTGMSHCCQVQYNFYTAKSH